MARGELIGGRVLTSLSLAPGQRERLGALAVRLGRSRSALVRDCIERLLAQYESKPTMGEPTMTEALGV